MTYLIHRTVTAVLNMMTTHEMLFATAPSSKELMLFGCAAYVHRNVCKTLNKLYKCAKKGAYLDNQDSRHRIYLPTKRKLAVTKHGPIHE